MDAHLLSLITFIPLVGTALILLLRGDTLIKVVAAIFAGIPLALSLRLLRLYNPGTSEFQFIERAPWIPSFSIEYFMGVDGLGVTMVLLTTLLSFICIFASWGINRGVKGYFSLFLLLRDRDDRGLLRPRLHPLLRASGRSCSSRCTS